MNVNEITFGVELETHIPAGRVSVGAYHVGYQVPGLPAGWTAQRDCSIQAPSGREGCEFVSPVLKGAEGLRQLVEVVGRLNEMGAKVNSSTGLHIHVGWNGDGNALDRLVSLVGNFEKAIFAATGTKSRERGDFCRGIQQYGTRDHAAENSSRVRYHVLNLTNLTNPRSRKRTVEFRAFSGSTNADKIVAYVRLCLALVEKSLDAKRSPKFIAKPTVKTSPVYRSGEGQTQLTRAFYALGWTKGRQSHTFGDLQADGVPSMKETKKELMRLGKKYDADNA